MIDFEEVLREHERREEGRLFNIEFAVQETKHEIKNFREELKEPMEAWRAVHGAYIVFKWIAGIGTVVAAIWAFVTGHKA
jgi:hypothetical protein